MSSIQCAFTFFLCLLALCLLVMAWRHTPHHRRRFTDWPREQHPSFFMPSRRWPLE